MFVKMDILEASQSISWQHNGNNDASLTKIQELHVSMNRQLGRAISRVSRHQIPSQTRVDIDKTSDWLPRIRLAVDPRSCGVMNA
jgi:hypothetical protein